MELKCRREGPGLRSRALFSVIRRPGFGLGVEADEVRVAGHVDQVGFQPGRPLLKERVFCQRLEEVVWLAAAQRALYLLVVAIEQVAVSLLVEGNRQLDTGPLEDAPKLWLGGVRHEDLVADSPQEGLV